MSEPPRSRRARDLAEAALVRLVEAYGTIPEFVLLGGLVPDLLCRRADRAHVGTTDVDVQVDLEIQGGMINAARLERALIEASFHPDSERVWRWRDRTAPGLEIKVEFLTDREDTPDRATVLFDDCEALGAINLRGTGFAAQDSELHTIASNVNGCARAVQIRVATLPGYLLAKIRAAHGRGLPKDWYDIAYVLLHNDEGGPVAAGRQVRSRFGPALVGPTQTALGELAANFALSTAQGSLAYADTMVDTHPSSIGKCSSTTRSRRSWASWTSYAASGDRRRSGPESRKEPQFKERVYKAGLVSKAVPSNLEISLRGESVP